MQVLRAYGQDAVMSAPSREQGNLERMAPSPVARGRLRLAAFAGCSRWLHGRSASLDQVAVAILSPHLDDAVLSCWHVLTQPGDVVVVNVFAGVPASLDAPAWWDRYTGATDSLERVHERIEEDRRALALTGSAAVNLDLLDEQYREADQLPAPPTAQIERLLAPGAHIYAPAAFANHTDHGLVRAAALKLRTRGFVVSLYADLPHAILHGWPAWVTGKRFPASRDLAAATWERSLVGTGISPDEMAPTVHELDPGVHARKLEALCAYRTQLEGLRELAGRPLADRETLGYEVVWALPSAATAGPASAGRHAAAGL
jgi:LmbE family N-acetylglucosaminyl deacetylase